MPPDTPPDPLEILMGAYQEPLEDTLLIARVYLLSPPNQVDPTPTAEWSPVVTHKVFWKSEANQITTFVGTSSMAGAFWTA